MKGQLLVVLFIFLMHVQSAILLFNLGDIDWFIKVNETHHKFTTEGCNEGPTMIF